MKKRILTTLLALCVMFTSIPTDVGVYAQGTQTELETSTTEGAELTESPETESAGSTEAVETGAAGETEREETQILESEAGENPETESMESEAGENPETETVESQAGENPETEVTESSETERTETEATENPETESVESEAGENPETEVTESTETEGEETEATENPETEETEETETESTENPETESMETEETEEIEETEETEAEEAEAELNFVMVESDYLQTPGTQNVVASVGTDEMKLEDLQLVYRNLTTGELFTAAAAARAEDMALFSLAFADERQTGVYQLVAISYAEGKKIKQIELSQLEMDVRFGVNMEVETAPDQVLLAEGAASEPQVDASVVTMDENGSVVSENTVEDVLDNGISGVPGIVKSEDLKGASGGNLVVVLDPGHDDTHTGAAYNGATEQNLVFKIAQYCKEELETYSGVTVYMTRNSTACPNGGSSVTSGECNLKRVEFAKSVGASVFVSFHLNASTNSSANGVGVYYPNSNYNAAIGETGKGLATEIYNKLTSLGLKQWSTGTIIWNANEDKYPDGSTADYLGVIRNCKKVGIPAVLIEHAFISGTSDYNNFLSSDEKLKKLGVEDAKAIAEYYGLSKKSDKPEISYTQSKSNGTLRVKWNAMEDVSYYEVYRDTKDAYDYKKIAEVSDETYYDDAAAKAGTKYYYIIRAVYTNGTFSEYSSAVTGRRLAAPTISYIKTAGSKKLELCWEKVTGAEGYKIYRENETTGKYEQIDKVASGSTTTYVDKVSVNNKSYRYKICAYNTNGGKEGVGAYSEEIAGKSVAAPKISSVVGVSAKNLEITWKKVSGADGYEIVRSTSSDGTYEKIATISSGSTVSYQDKSVKTGKTYYYKIRAVKTNNGKKGYSGYSAAVSGKTVAKSKITSVTAVDASTLQIKWSKVSGAYGYRIKRSTSKNGTYKVIKTIKSAKTVSYKDTSVKTGTTYYYKVETLIKTDGTTGYSGDSAAVSGKTVAKTAISYVVSAGSKTLEVGWKKITGAWGYRVKRSTSKNGTYKTIATIKGKSTVTYKDTSVSTGKKYYYKVEVINQVNGTKGYSGDSKVVSGSTLAKTSITSVKAVNSKSIKIGWKKVSGASGYQIYRSSSKNGSYKKVATVSGSSTKSYTDQSVSAGKTYYYKVRAYKTNNKKTGVASYTAVQQAWTLKAVKISNVSESGGKKVTLNWDQVSKADGYRIYRSTSPDSGFKQIKEIKSGSTLKYSDTTVKSGNVYYYRIAAITTIKGSAVGRGNYSSVLAVPVLAASKMKEISLTSDNTLKISWGSVKNADGYQLSVSIKEDGTYKTLAKTPNKSYIHGNLASGETYYYKVRPYVKLSNGVTVYGAWSAVMSQTAAYAIMGNSTASVDSMVAYYDSQNYQYPSYAYASKGAASAEEFFQILKEEAEAEGVKAEVLFAQVMLETGGLQFGGDVSVHQCNFGGLGATGNGVSGETFADVRTGLRAQTQHLKAYASTEALNNPCVDSRFQYVTRGCAPYVEWLAIPKNPYGKGWATDPDYGTKLLATIRNL